MPGGSENLISYTLERIEKSPVPLCFHLDHGQSFECVMQAIHYGCSSVMYDGSKLPIEENIAMTKKIVEIAHACGVSVEAEIGHVAAPEGSVEGSVADPDLFTKPEDAVRFVAETDVDALAVAVGTVHGVYKGEPHLDLQRLEAIRGSISVPLVMHGGSGLRVEDFKAAIHSGMSKINYFTKLSIAAANASKEVIEEKGAKIRFPDIYKAGYAAVVKDVVEQIGIFGTPQEK
jgi:fructose-bisphosphate aldolase class II